MSLDRASVVPGCSGRCSRFWWRTPCVLELEARQVLSVVLRCAGKHASRLARWGVANVNGGVVSVSVGMRPSWNYGSVWKAW